MSAGTSRVYLPTGTDAMRVEAADRTAIRVVGRAGTPLRTSVRAALLMVRRARELIGTGRGGLGPPFFISTFVRRPRPSGGGEADDYPGHVGRQGVALGLRTTSSRRMHDVPSYPDQR